MQPKAIDEPAFDKDCHQEINDIRLELLLRGIHLRLGRDFETLSAHIQRAGGRYSLHEQFDPSLDMDGAIDALWISGFDTEGRLLTTQAASLLDLNGSTVADHVRKTLPRYIPKSPPVDHRTIRATPGPKARRMTGKVAYHGEMWLAEGYRDQTTACLLIRLGILIANREWNPDAIFGLMHWMLACRGFNMRIGYTHCEPVTLSWRRSDTGNQHQLWMVYLEREDIRFLNDLPAVEFARILATERNG